jgi:hypothetical protein
MTPARQERKRYSLCVAACAGLVLGLVAVMPRPHAAVTEQIVVDWHTGLAIAGYDPVAYFTNGKPMVGSERLELRYGGAVWRFCNVGNRAAFAAQPDVYKPKFGGYDALGVARGVAVGGNAEVWFITGERLYLFYDRGRRAKFVADPERVIATAERKWPDVLKTLSP